MCVCVCECLNCVYTSLQPVSPLFKYQLSNTVCPLHHSSVLQLKTVPRPQTSPSGEVRRGV